LPQNRPNGRLTRVVASSIVRSSHLNARLPTHVLPRTAQGVQTGGCDAPDPERSTMSPMHQPLDKASGQQVRPASRLCARSQIAEPPCPLPQQGRTRNLVVSSRSFTDISAVEGGFFFTRKSAGTRPTPTARRSGNGVAACGTGKAGRIPCNGGVSVVFIEEDQLFAPGERIELISVLKNAPPTALFGSSVGQRACA